jgi:hypothetical protein
MTPAGAAIAIVLALAHAQEPAPSGLDDAPVLEAVERFDTVILDGSTPEPDALEAELRLRLATHEIVVARADMPRPGAAFVWVLVEPRAETAHLRLITSDGRAFTREVETPPEEHARVVAGAIANMVDAIENNRIAPEETGAEVPMPPAPAPAPAPPETRPPEPAPAMAPPPAHPPPPRSWLGVALDGGLALAFGPPTDVQGVGGGIAGLGVHWIHRSGALATGQVHGVFARGGGYVAARARIYAGAGYAWRPSRFELLAHGGLVVAPIFVTGDSSDLRTAGGERRGAAPLVGGRVAISPGWLGWLKRERLALRMGITVDASYTVEARAPAGAIRISRDDGDTNTAILRAGGFEIGALLSVEARFALGR